MNEDQNPLSDASDIPTVELVPSRSLGPPSGRRKIRGRGLVNWFSHSQGKKPVKPTKLELEDVLEHNKADDCWVIIKGAVYDVTEFLSFHPGGAQLVLKYAGKDCTDAFIKYHHWIDPHGLLENYFMGQCTGVSAKGPKQPGLQHTRSNVPALGRDDLDALPTDSLAAIIPGADPAAIAAAKEAAAARMERLASEDRAALATKRAAAADSSEDDDAGAARNARPAPMPADAEPAHASSLAPPELAAPDDSAASPDERPIACADGSPAVIPPSTPTPAAAGPSSAEGADERDVDAAGVSIDVSGAPCGPATGGPSERALRARAQQRADADALGDLTCLFEQISGDGRHVTAEQVIALTRQLGSEVRG